MICFTWFCCGGGRRHPLRQTKQDKEMKILINRENPQIRITAPEIIRWFSDFYVVKAEAGRKGRILVVKSKDWTLVEEEPVEWSEEDEAMRDNILRILSYFVGTVECDSNPSLSTSYPIFQREMDWLKSLRPQPKVKWSVEEDPVDLEKEIKKHTDLFQADIEYPLRLTAIKFYELGKKRR